MHLSRPVVLLAAVCAVSAVAQERYLDPYNQEDAQAQAQPAVPVYSAAPQPDRFLQDPDARVAERERLQREAESSEWQRNARFFAGVRSGVAIPPGGTGVAPSVGIEVGVSAPSGIGFGLHLLGMSNPPAIEALRIGKAQYGVGAMADVRMYFQSVEPLTLYGTLAGGFVAGPGTMDTGNIVLPMINPGFGARVKVTDTAYLAFEFGLAGFYIPFVTISGGWEPMRKPHPAR